MKKILILIFLLLLTFITIEDGSKTNENKISSQLSSTLPQQLTIDTEKLNTLFSFYGSATYLSSDKSFRLVNNAKNQAGTVYFNDRLSLDYDFEINMDISMFNRTGEVADGLAIGFTQSPIGTIGNYGSGMGVINTINTTALIIDSYKNTNDPNVPSLSIRYTGPTKDNNFRNASGTVVSLNTQSSGTILKNATNFRNQIVPLKVNYTASTKMITYTILGSTLSGSVKNINPTLGAAFFITSSTGEVFDLVKVFIKSGTAYLVTSTPTSLSVTEIENQALKFVASKPVYIPNGSNKYPEGTIMKIEGVDTVFTVNSQGEVIIPKNQRPLYDATSNVTFSETSKGDSISFSIFIPGYKTHKPNVSYVYNNQDEVVFSIKRDDNTNYPSGSTISFPGIDDPFTISSNQTVTIPKSLLPTFDTQGLITVKETNREVSNGLQFTVPGSKTNTPSSITTLQDIVGNLVITPRKPNGSLYPTGTVLTSPHISQPITISADGTFEIDRSLLPESSTPTQLYFKALNKDISDSYDITLSGTSNSPKDTSKANLESLYTALKSLIQNSIYLSSEQKTNGVNQLTTKYDEGILVLESTDNTDDLISNFNTYKNYLENSALASVKSGNTSFVTNYVSDLVSKIDPTLQIIIDNGLSNINGSTSITQVNEQTENTLQQINDYIDQEVHNKKNTVNLELLNFSQGSNSIEVNNIIVDALDLITNLNYNQEQEIQTIIDDAKALISLQNLEFYKQSKINASNEYVDQLVSSVDDDLANLIKQEQDKIYQATTSTQVDDLYEALLLSIQDLVDSKIETTKNELDQYLTDITANYPNIDTRNIIDTAKASVNSKNYNDEDALNLIKVTAVQAFDQAELDRQKQLAKDNVDNYVESLVSTIDTNLLTIINDGKSLIDAQTSLNDVTTKKDETIESIVSYINSMVKSTQETYEEMLRDYVNESSNTAIENIISNFKDEINSKNYNKNSELTNLLNEFKRQIDNQELLDYKSNTKNEIDAYVDNLTTAIDSELLTIINNGKDLIDNLQTVTSIDGVKETTKNEITKYLGNKVKDKQSEIGRLLGDFAGRPYSTAVENIINGVKNEINSLNYNDEDEIQTLIDAAKNLIKQQTLQEFKDDAKQDIDQYVDNKTSRIDPELQLIIDNGKISIDNLNDEASIKEEKNTIANQIDDYIQSKIDDLKNEIYDQAKNMLGDDTDKNIEDSINKLLDQINSENYNDETFIDNLLKKIEDAVSIHLNNDIDASKQKIESDLSEYAGTPISNEILIIINNQKEQVNSENYRDAELIASIIQEGKSLIDNEKLRVAIEAKISDLNTFMKNSNASDDLKEIINEGIDAILDVKNMGELNETYDEIIELISKQVAIDALLEQFEDIYHKYVDSGRYGSEGLVELENFYNSTVNLLKSNNLKLSDAVEILNNAEVQFANIKTIFVFSESFRDNQENPYQDDPNHVYMSVSNTPGFTFGTTLVVEKLQLSPSKADFTSQLDNYLMTYHPIQNNNQTFDFDSLTNLNLIIGLEVKLYDEQNIMITHYQGDYLVSFLLTPEMKNMENFIVVYFADNELKVFETTIKDGWVTFRTTHFSEYFVMGSPIPETVDTTRGWIIVILLLVIVIETIIIIFKRRQIKMQMTFFNIIPAFFFNIDESMELIAIVVLSIIILMLLSYIIYLYLLNRKIYVRKDEKIIPTAFETKTTTHYNYSFTALLSQSTELTKSNYMNLKDYMTQFPAIKNVIHWENETFIYHDIELFNFSIRNQKLDLNVPKRFIHIVESVLKDKTYETHEQDISQIKQIIFLITNEFKLTQTNIVNKKYDLMYRGTEDLIKSGLVKIETITTSK